MENKKMGFGGALKEAWRKFLVSLKRKPQMIPMVVFVIAFLEYSMHLTMISDTTAKIQGANMGLCGFITMLFSMLALVCFGNAFPNRKPVNRPMWILMFVMVAIVCVADNTYLNAIYKATVYSENPIAVTSNTIYIAYAEYYLRQHMIILAVASVLTLLLPVYSKWIKKIKTSIEVEDNGSMAEIELSSDN